MAIKKKSVLNKQSVDRKKKKKRKTDRKINALNLIRGILIISLKVAVLVALLVGISAFLMYGYDYLRNAPFLMLKRVEINGVEQDIQKDLMDIIDLNKNANLLFLDLEKTAQAIKAHPWVRTVQLDRQFPETLSVEIKKHRPVALVMQDGIHYMNDRGEIFKTPDVTDPLDYPVITGIHEKDPRARKQLARALDIINVLSAEKEPWTWNEISEIHAEDDDFILYFSHLPVRIRANRDTLAEKLEGLSKMTKHLSDTGRIHLVTGIDLTPFEGAVVSFKKG